MVVDHSQCGMKEKVVIDVWYIIKYWLATWSSQSKDQSSWLPETKQSEGNTCSPLWRLENHLACLLTNVAAKKNNHSLMDIEHFLRIRQIGKQSANFVRFSDTSQFWPWCGGLACVYLIDFLHVTGSHIARLTHYNALIGTFAMMRSTSGDWSGHEKEATIVPLFPVWGILTEDSLKKGELHILIQNSILYIWTM